MSSRPNVVLLCCGSFNPLTNMHLRMFEIARDHLQKTNVCNVVGGIISPVHDDYEKKDLASATDRCKMVELALESSDWIRLVSWECKQNAWQKTSAVLRHYQDAFDTMTNSNNLPAKRKKVDSDVDFDEADEIDRALPNNWDRSMPVKVMLLCGGDVLESFAVPNLWKDEDIKDIVTSYGMVVISRTESNPHKFIYESDVLANNQNNIHVVTDFITNEISATKIRRALRRGNSVRYLLQDNVIHYIYLHGLYGCRETEYIQNPFLTPSPSRDAYPPPYELVKFDNVVVATTSKNTLSVPVPTHSRRSMITRKDKQQDGSRRSQRTMNLTKSETLV